MRLTAQDSFSSSVAIIIIVAVTATLFWEESLRTYLTLWVVTLFMVLMMRTYYAIRFFKYHSDLQQTKHIFTLLTLLSALLMSGGFMFLFNIGDIAHQVLIITIIAGISAGVVISLSYLKRLSISYLFILLFPLVYMLIIHKTDIFHVLSYLVFLFLIMLSIFSLKYNRNIINALVSKNKILTTKKTLQASKNSFKTIFDEVPIGIFTYDKDLRVTKVNRAFAKALQVPMEKLFRLDMTILKDKSITNASQKVFENKKAHYRGPYHTTLTHLDLWIDFHAIALKDSQGNIISGLGIVEDITKEVQNQQKLEYQAFYDSLTGLTNRASFRNYLEQFMKKLRRPKEYGALLFIDLDDFKNINDSIGHDVGKNPCSFKRTYKKSK